MAPRYRVTLVKEEGEYLEEISTKGKRAERTVLYARAILLLEAGGFGPKWIVAKVVEALGVTTRSLEHLKKRFVEEGLSAVIERKTRVKPPKAIRFGGGFEAQLLVQYGNPWAWP
ncbi:helix-turn-helix domain-containing protein [Desulfosediminicola flagellatus]|uniref:helix-turn-helix domain-containing protein n=1 Tax=Desulfosediminicola flagellatus TaxID=2569541 RepID=UPI0010AD62D5|nr:helix-turn-helix domain-containing protein [Desulfosediminicola flagellatus]